MLVVCSLPVKSQIEAGSQIQAESAPASSESANSTDVTQPGTSSAADDLGLELEMSVDDIDESEDERNEVLVDDSDID